GERKAWFRSVVLPAPRKPVSTVIGVVMFASTCTEPTRDLLRGRETRSLASVHAGRRAPLQAQAFAFGAAALAFDLRARRAAAGAGRSGASIVTVRCGSTISVRNA